MLFFGGLILFVILQTYVLSLILLMMRSSDIIHRGLFSDMIGILLFIRYMLRLPLLRVFISSPILFLNFFNPLNIVLPLNFKICN